MECNSFKKDFDDACRLHVQFLRLKCDKCLFTHASSHIYHFLAQTTKYFFLDTGKLHFAHADLTRAKHFRRQLPYLPSLCLIGPIVFEIYYAMDAVAVPHTRPLPTLDLTPLME